jgi:hypothetical protein
MAKDKAIEWIKVIVPMVIIIVTYLVGGAYGVAIIQKDIQRSNECNERQDKLIADHELRIRAAEKHVAKGAS